MAEINTIFSELEGVGDLGKRFAALYVLHARIAAGLENKEPGFEDLKKDISQAWMETATYFDMLVKENPDEAFNLALTLSLLPRNTDPEKEKVYRWMRGDGPALLAKESVRKPFLQYLSSSKAPEFFATMQEYMGFDMTDIHNAKAAFHEPKCYLAMATMYLGIKLSGDELTKNFTESAKERLRDPHVSEVARFYQDIPDTAELAKELEPYLFHPPMP